MNELRVIWVGKSQAGFVADGIAHYQKRCGSFEKILTEDVRAATHSGRDTSQGIDKEGEALLRKIQPGDWVVLLDAERKKQGGNSPSTEAFAASLKSWQEKQGRVIFLIGGAYGFSLPVRERANATLSLSPMTFPHQLVRVIFLEQLYRALSLNAGHGYHHA